MEQSAMMFSPLNSQSTLYYSLSLSLSPTALLFPSLSFSLHVKEIGMLLLEDVWNITAIWENVVQK